MDVMVLCERLSPTQRSAILDNFCKANPHWRGAHVEDIIDNLDNCDGYLAEVEDAWERFPELRQDGFGSAVRCLKLAGEPIIETNLRELLIGSKHRRKI